MPPRTLSDSVLGLYQSLLTPLIFYYQLRLSIVSDQHQLPLRVLSATLALSAIICSICVILGGVPVIKAPRICALMALSIGRTAIALRKHARAESRSLFAERASP
jgi:hypothetical protein